MVFPYFVMVYHQFSSISPRLFQQNPVRNSLPSGAGHLARECPEGKGGGKGKARQWRGGSFL